MLLVLLRLGFVALIIGRLLRLLRGLRRGGDLWMPLEGQSFQCGVFRRKHRKVRRVSFGLEVPDRMRFLLRRETALDRFFKAIGLAREWQTGDAPFDEQVFVASEDESLTQALSLDRELRAAIVALLGVEARPEIEYRGRRLFCDFRPAESLRSDSDRAVIERYAGIVAPALIRMRERLAHARSGAWEPARDAALARKSRLFVVCAGIGILGALVGLGEIFANGMSRQVVEAAIPRDALWTTIVVASGLLALTMVWVGVSAHTPALLLDILLIAAPATWLIGHGAFTVYNQVGDDFPSQRVAVRVDSTNQTIGRRAPKSYSVRVHAWPAPGAERTVRIETSLYARLKPGDCLYANWHPGKLGDAWVDGFALGDAACRPGEWR